MLIDLSESVVVLDLDDTLYPEQDYVESGIKFVCKFLNELVHIDLYSDLEEARINTPRLDWIEYLCRKLGWPASAKESLLWVYRLHSPEISLSNICIHTLQTIKAKSKGCAILTDGRSITQRLKLKSLGLSDWPIYISQDHSSEKPSKKRFKLIQSEFPAKCYLYIADNVSKDFVACASLGWIGVHISLNQSIHRSGDQLTQPDINMPDVWVNDWDELSSLFV